MKYLFIVFLFLAACGDDGRDWDDDSDDDDSEPAGCTQDDVDQCDDEWAECVEYQTVSACSSDRCDCLAWNECDDEWAAHDCDLYT